MSDWAPLSDDWLKDFIADSNPISPINPYEDFEPELALVSPTRLVEPVPDNSPHCDWLSDILQDLPDVPKNSPESHLDFALLDKMFESGQSSACTDSSPKPSSNGSDQAADKTGVLCKDVETLQQPKECCELLAPKAKPEASSLPIHKSRRPLCRVGKNPDQFFNKVNEKLHMLKENNCLTPRALEYVFNTKDVLKDCNLGRCTKHKSEQRARSKRPKRRSSLKSHNTLAPVPIKTEQLPETPMSVDLFDGFLQCKPCGALDPEPAPFLLSPPYSSASSPRSYTIQEHLNPRFSCNVPMNS